MKQPARTYGPRWAAAREIAATGGGHDTADARRLARLEAVELMAQIEHEHEERDADKEARRWERSIPLEERRQELMDEIDGLLSAGESVERIGERLNRSLAALSQQAARHGRRDLQARFDRAYRYQRKAAKAA